MAEIEDLVKASLDQDYNRANEIFGDLMGLKIGDALEQEKIKLGNQIYNGETDIEDDEDDFDIDDLEDFDDDDLEDDEDDEELDEDDDED